MSHERRPHGKYFEERIPLLSQGDIFADVPLAYPTPADELVVDDSEQLGTRRFLSGPLSIGPAMLTTPTCSMRAQGSDGGNYAHPVRTLVPLRPIQELLDLQVLDPAKHRLADKRDSLINYMFIPPSSDLGIEESLALLYMPVTLHHEMIENLRITQLTYDATAQLQKKLVWHVSSVLLQRQGLRPTNGLMSARSASNPYDFRRPIGTMALLAGRDAELEQIDELLRGAALGNPGHFSLFGPAGMGSRAY